MSDDRQALRRRRRPPVAPAPQEPMRIIVGNEEDTPDWMVSDTSGRGLPQNGAEETRTGNARTRRPRRSGNPDDFADEAAAQRPKRGARRAHGVGGKEDRRAESRTKNRCVRAESARPKEKKRAPDEQKGKRAPRASNPPNDHRRALRRDRPSCWRSSAFARAVVWWTSSRRSTAATACSIQTSTSTISRFRAKRSMKRRRSSPSRCSR